MHDTSPHDVIIAGAGPVGLFLACELRLADLSVLVLEQAPHPDSPLKRLPFGMRGLSSPSVEALYRRGLLEAVAARQAQRDPAAASAHWSRQPRAAGGHFAGMQFYLDRVDQAHWPYRVPGPCAPHMATDLAHLESVLAARAAELGAEIRRGVAVEQVEQSAHEVRVRTRDVSLRARWLVGCDGGRSTVRKSCGFGFTGTEPEFTGYSAQVELADPGLLAPGRHHTATGMYTYERSGVLAMADFDGGAFHRSGPITPQHIESVLRRVSGADARVTRLELAATWTDRAFQATTYRQGRVLLAGDAAHVHSPLGGQGLNLGLGDAMNLGWKLAATVRGEAPDGLLDSYCAERHPVGAQVLDWSRAQVALMRPGPGSRALAAIMRELIETGDGTTYFAGRIWGLSLRYELGAGHDLVGRSAPDVELADASRLGQHLRNGNGLLLDFTGDAQLQAWSRRRHGRIAYLGGDAGIGAKLGLGALLVRPDGIVAWAGSGIADRAELQRAASRWFGAA
ncbi:FAD-dependent monooxygenase [Herbaspirillum sp. WKF16]|uniref:FAD-dependent monooxygenase n=1 Tax=Herbaspirillum sp. WKF16 TaxID=3028312 RepID=UPI0023A9369B|nr:FAD-dependent monooxygenase [Herbaspirillum sp. WKF16]WDZ97237.1 FAD-dependent monooxygenase [Herbaspirillum sp. WKF16]